MRWPLRLPATDIFAADYAEVVSFADADDTPRRCHYMMTPLFFRSYAFVVTLAEDVCCLRCRDIRYAPPRDMRHAMLTPRRCAQREKSEPTLVTPTPVAHRPHEPTPTLRPSV